MPLTLRQELVRKTVHLAWAIVPIAYAQGVPRDVILLFLAAAGAIALGVELGRFRSSGVRMVFRRAVAPLLRDHEHRHWSGATWLVISLLLVALLFDRPTAIAAMWAVTVGDAAAALVGRTIGRARIGNTLKTVEGSMACAVSTATGAYLVAGITLIPSLVAGILAAGAEWPTRPLDDNVRIGLAVGTGILLCHMAFS